MPAILHLETSTKICSVALSADGQLLSLREQGGSYSHSEKLTIFCSEALEEAGLKFSDLDAVAVSKGPGSYTGLRIGVSAAKGFCYALDIPLLSVPTLKAMAYRALREIPGIGSALLCPMLDARRMEVYCAIYDNALNGVLGVNAHVLEATSFGSYLEKNRILFFGEGSVKAQGMISHENAVFIDGMDPSASAMVHLAEEAFSSGKFEDLAYFEPFYLKEFTGKKGV